MDALKKVWKTVGIFFAVVFVGTVLLTLAFMVPLNEDNKAASIAIMEKEGWYPMVPVLSRELDTYFHSYNPGVLDDGSDQLMLTVIFGTKTENPLYAAMDTGGYSTRYWHGYISVLRPLLAVFDYGEIRIANSMIQILLVLLFFLLIYQKMGIKYALLALTSYCFLMPLALSFCLHYSSVFYVTYIFLLYLASRKEEKIPDGIKLYWCFMVAGMLTSYLDLLSYPLYTWGVPMIWWLLFQKKAKTHGYYVKKVIYTGLWWLLGYGGMWFMKWCLGSIITKHNIFESAFEMVRTRANAGEGLAFSERLTAIYFNWKHYEYKIYVIILLMWLLFVLSAAVRNGVTNASKNKALLLIGVSSWVWYFVLSNHSTVHHFFAYRTWGICILAIFALLIGAAETHVLQEKQGKKKTVLMMVLCGSLAVVLSFLVKEDVGTGNGYCEYEEILMQEGEICAMDFVPSFPRINSFTLCAKTDSHNGICKVIVADKETELYEEHIPLKEYKGVTAASIPVSWKLEKEKVYSIYISFEDAEKPTYLLVTSDKNMPLPEYGEACLEGKNQNGQILSILNYRYRPLSKYTLSSLIIGWMAFLFATGLTFFVRAKVDDIN